jgi:transcriptional regulator with XRE-family HTH domain
MSYQREARTAGGNRLRALREARNMTQLDVELEGSLGIGYLQRLELGKVQHPERDTLERILAALGANFGERREVLELFGYALAITVPTEAEIRWAIDVFQAEVENESLPVYLLDCLHRLLSWNAPVSKLFGESIAEVPGVQMPRLIFDPRLGVTPSVVNAEAFFSTQIRILLYERQRRDDEAWYSGLINEMRQYETFDKYWIRQNIRGQAYIPMRPIAQLQFDNGQGLTQFRLVCETFVHDPRFRVIHCIPADSATIRKCLEWQG